MPRITTRVTGHPRRARRRPGKLFKFPNRFWDLQTAGVRRTAIIGFAIGVLLGCLFGAMMGVLPNGAAKDQPEILSVNERTGKPQLHIQGKPEIK
ncbi:MAG TPA: hypothetical protein VGF73_07105 [Chthoniobacterales bacterium]|jgi:ABC-type nitrate/sulfonate/bicarbonate transport system permease component